jgi:hypothetical protein
MVLAAAMQGSMATSRTMPCGLGTVQYELLWEFCGGKESCPAVCRAFCPALELRVHMGAWLLLTHRTAGRVRAGQCVSSSTVHMAVQYKNTTLLSCVVASGSCFWV